MIKHITDIVCKYSIGSCNEEYVQTVFFSLNTSYKVCRYEEVRFNWRSLNERKYKHVYFNNRNVCLIPKNYEYSGGINMNDISIF